MSIKTEQAKILVVDDIAKNIQVLANILNSPNYIISYAQSGRMALQMLTNNEYDLILLDIMMPEMDGFQVCQHIQNNPTTKGIPIIFLTAKTDQESINRAFALGGVDYITKPFDAPELLARINTHIRLQQTQRNLQEVIAAKDLFMSIIAHDLKNPFSAFIGLSEIMLEYIASKQYHKLESYAKNIGQTARKGHRLLENILSWAQSQTGRLEMKPTPFLFNPNEDILDVLESNAKEKNIRIQLQLDNQLSVYADKAMVNTVVRNLLSNAIKFSRQDSEIWLKSYRLQNRAFIEVVDQGVGMDEKMINKLFRIDKKIISKGTSGERGNGLGLVLCKEFMQKNHGHIQVESSPDKGSKFTLNLPTSPPD